MLQDLLNLGLVDIGSDDSRFAKMESASTKLLKQFEESPPLMITATLVSLDENVDEDTPFLELVEGLVIEEWNTLRNTHVNRPRELLRSITISALAAATDKNPERSAIVWNTAASRLIHDQTSLGKAADLLKQCFERVFSTAESEALRRTGMLEVAQPLRRRKKSTGSTPEAPTLTGSIESNEVLQEVARAAGPQFPQGQALNNANPHWSNQAQQWSYEFTPRMTEALVKAVNLGTSRLAESIAADIAAHIASMEEHLRKQLGQVESLQSKLAESEVAGRMRLDVLWWSQARYSPSQNASYSVLPTSTAAIAAAVDLTAMVPALAPASVTHVLGETMAACTRSERLSLLDHLKKLNESPPHGFEELLPAGVTNTARVPLLEIAAEVVGGSSVSEDDLRSRAGVDPELMLEPAELAMWLFRELQARRIVEDTA
ncbi:GTPase-associated system all-helical protein GASH [Billgrantia montanilacus]|uniref:GTPase-associated system helical domain-containing protein n=1 Tax=Billgrantia montanilacus TaxID=2282305 RepID=A0A368U006_9GAMM|nr:GTPase-associated system all-helical protein GASH [Halomonas montanilacus]RCV89827.1 hypothetical protein DU505_09590 [Halomonas montanilacus]